MYVPIYNGVAETRRSMNTQHVPVYNNGAAGVSKSFMDTKYFPGYNGVAEARRPMLSIQNVSSYNGVAEARRHVMNVKNRDI
jgi:hypothetical protein